MAPHRTPRTPRATSARRKLLEAAERILREGGPGPFTADAVVAAAGVSKGAFFYHFRTKDDLWVALIEACAADLDADVAAEVARDPEPVGRWSRARLRCAFVASGPGHARLFALTRAIVNALIESADVAAKIGELRRRIFDDARGDRLPIEHRHLIELAGDGLWFGEALGTRFEMTPAERRAVVRHLVELTYGPGGKPAAPRRARAARGRTKR